MTILEALTFGEQRLKSRFKTTELSSPRIDAQVLLASAREKGSSYLFSHMDEELSIDVERRFRKAIERRVLFEPVAYIVGHKAFYGRDFFVTKETLIPRPETELLVEEALKAIDARPLIIDVGTGSGAIAITLALETGRPILAFDLSKEALEVAKKNANALTAETLVHFEQGNLLMPLVNDAVPYTDFSSLLICANLPYLPTATLPTLEPDVRLFEPTLALLGGVDGLDLYHTLLEELSTHANLLPKKQTILCEIDPSQPALIASLAGSFGYTCTILNDLSSKPRLAILAR